MESVWVLIEHWFGIFMNSSIGNQIKWILIVNKMNSNCDWFVWLDFDEERYLNDSSTGNQINGALRTNDG